MSTLSCSVADFPLVINIQPHNETTSRVSLLIRAVNDSCSEFTTSIFHFDFEEEVSLADRFVAESPHASYFDFWQQKFEAGQVFGGSCDLDL